MLRVCSASSYSQSGVSGHVLNVFIMKLKPGAKSSNGCNDAKYRMRVLPVDVGGITVMTGSKSGDRLVRHIGTLKRRLDAINQLRVDRARAMGLHSSRSTVYCRHCCISPLMPGYDGNVPSICLYTPDETQRHYLNRLEL